MKNHKLEYDISNIDSVKLYKEIKARLGEVARACLTYKNNDKEYITENLSLEWLAWVDSHSFHIWLELKKAQKQKYNVQNYTIILQLYMDIHTNR